MARAELSPGIESLRGKLSGWSGMQARFKQWKDDSGHVIKVGPQEVFKRRRRPLRQRFGGMPAVRQARSSKTRIIRDTRN